MSDDISCIPPGSVGYPALLTDLEDPPTIWFRGASLPAGRCVSIVGSRHPTPYGQRVARRLAEACARAGLTVVSGLAIGTDSAAHLGALDPPGGTTLAVMATGVDIVHPASNRELVRRILPRGGLLSTYPPGTPPGKHRFLERNAVIAALCEALVIVEGIHPSSGALSTVVRAQGLGREVLAVPGMITTPEASAPNALLRDGCAPCLDVRDVLTAVDWFHTSRGGAATKPLVSDLAAKSLVGDPRSQRILELLEGTALDGHALAEATQSSPEETLEDLVDLEMAGLVRRTPLGMYRLA